MQTLHARWLRRTAWMLALASLPAALSLWQGRARANERILDAGAELLAYARASELDGSAPTGARSATRPAAPWLHR
jgi:hypothetical protein